MNPARIDRKESALTIVELLVVIAIIGVLASLLLPTFGRTLRRTREAQCMNNLKQMANINAMYLEDHEQKYPRRSVRERSSASQWGWRSKPTQHTLGGQDPKPGHFARHFLQATNRPWYAYQGNAKIFHCPEDQGHLAMPAWPTCPLDHHHAKPTLWDTVGSSYQWNAGINGPRDPLRPPPHPQVTLLPRGKSLPGMTSADRVEDPQRYILMHEPPARPLMRSISLFRSIPFWSQWHRDRGRTDFRDPTIAPPQFWSQVLFVDGHVAMHDFSKSIQTDPYFPFEGTKDWIWFQTNGWNNYTIR